MRAFIKLNVGFYFVNQENRSSFYRGIERKMNGGDQHSFCSFRLSAFVIVFDYLVLEKLF